MHAKPVEVKNGLPSKRFKSQEIDDGEIEEKIKVTDDMFEAAKLMKNGVAHVKDLDMSLVKNKVSLNKQAGTCDVILIDIDQAGEINVNKQTKTVK